MNGVWTINRSVLGAATACVSVLAAQAQPVTDKEIEGIDDRYAISTKVVGDDKVQLHSRHDTEGGSLHKIHTFSCVEETYEVVFEGKEVPEAFPTAGDSANYQALERTSEHAPLAQHACKEHGVPVLRMDW